MELAKYAVKLCSCIEYFAGINIGCFFFISTESLSAHLPIDEELSTE